MQFQYTTSYFAAGYGFNDLSSSLATVEMQGTVRLIFSARDGNLVNSIALGAATVQAQGDITWSRQTGPDFAFQQTSGLPRLYDMAAFDYPMVMQSFNANGTPAWSSYAYTPSLPYLTDVSVMQVLEYAGGDLAALQRRGAVGLDLFRLSEMGALTPLAQLLDGPKSYLAGVTDTAVLQRGADQLLLAISPLENGISSYRIGANGAVEWIDSIGAQNGLPVNGLAMLQTANIAGTDFAILASTLSSSLTVLRVNAMGVFFETDTVIDDRSTRFDHLASFDTFVAQGRLFVVAAGSDAGVTLFELLPGGTLSHVETFVLEGAQGPMSVTGIKAEVLGNSVDILMIDARADRILHYDLSITTLGGRFDGVSGDGLDNRILGTAGADVLNGAGGADFLHDGAGSDSLTGGAGADVFVFARDGVVDRITDFSAGEDQIDLGAWGRIYSAQSLTLTSTATGAEVAFGDERLIITSSGGGPLVLTDADFLF